MVALTVKPPGEFALADSLDHTGRLSGELLGRLYSLVCDGSRLFHAVDFVLRLYRSFLFENARSHFDVRIRLLTKTGIEVRTHGILSHHADSRLRQSQFAEVRLQRFYVISGRLHVVDPGREARKMIRGVDFE